MKKGTASTVRANRKVCKVFEDGHFNVNIMVCHSKINFNQTDKQSMKDHTRDIAVVVAEYMNVPFATCVQSILYCRCS